MDLVQENSGATDPGPVIRPAATTVLWRQAATGPQVLMGQRGAAAVFMPSKFVFPGGAVDDADADSPPGVPLMAGSAARLMLACPADAPAPATIAAAAVRELFEETGLRLQPSAAELAVGAGLRFVFRAITPPGRGRRFDARFFLADARWVDGDPDDFGAASDELSHLHWIGLTEARDLDLPFITEVVLSEIAHLLRGGQDDAGVPFFDNSGPVPTFRRLA